MKKKSDILPIEFTKWFKKVDSIAVDCSGKYFAFDLRDNSDFQIKEYHVVKSLIESGNFIFGKEKRKRKIALNSLNKKIR